MSASSRFYYKEICYDARSHERKISFNYFFLSVLINGHDWTSKFGLQVPIGVLVKTVVQLRVKAHDIIYIFG